MLQCYGHIPGTAASLNGEGHIFKFVLKISLMTSHENQPTITYRKNLSLYDTITSFLPEKTTEIQKSPVQLNQTVGNAEIWPALTTKDPVLRYS